MIQTTLSTVYFEFFLLKSITYITLKEPKFRLISLPPQQQGGVY